VSALLFFLPAPVTFASRERADGDGNEKIGARDRASG
jgi:hypothetical protein